MPKNVKLTDWWVWKLHLVLRDKNGPKIRGGYGADFGTKNRIKQVRSPAGRGAVGFYNPKWCWLVVNGDRELHGDDGERLHRPVILTDRFSEVSTRYIDAGGTSPYGVLIPIRKNLMGRAMTCHGTYMDM